MRVTLVVWTLTAALLVDAVGSEPRPTSGRRTRYVIPIPTLNGRKDRWRKSYDLRPIGSPTAPVVVPLPNPLGIYDTPLSLDFQDHRPFHTARSIDADDFDSCVGYFFRSIESWVRDHGDGPAPSGRHRLHYAGRTVGLTIVSFGPALGERAISYKDSIMVLAAIELKMKREGYRERSGDIVTTEAGHRIGHFEVVALPIEARLIDDEETFNTLPRHPRGSPPPKDENKPLQLQSRAALPNPYSVPGTAISIDFDEHDDQYPLQPAAEVESCLHNSLRRITAHIEAHGDGPIPRKPNEGLEYTFGNLRFAIRSVRADASISYNDTANILWALSSKMRREGYRVRFGDILGAATGYRLGDIWLSRSTPGDEDRVRNRAVRLDPIPNPYPLPHSELSIEFDEPGTSLRRRDVTECIFLARRKVLAHIEEHGEGPMPPGLAYSWRSVEFRLFQMPHQHRVTLNDTLDILAAYAIKEGREGFASLWGTIIPTEHHEQVVAQAILGPSANERPPSDAISSP
ncbi:MAG: hypothetical protein LQ346_002396 [Caloplaca aetnensis]|nr:MAG: hypothetical protein LQ346_002396 [Caloplaca aetnensis]